MTSKIIQPVLTVKLDQTNLRWAGNIWECLQTREPFDKWICKEWRMRCQALSLHSCVDKYFSWFVFLLFRLLDYKWVIDRNQFVEKMRNVSHFRDNKPWDWFGGNYKISQVNSCFSQDVKYQVWNRNYKRNMNVYTISVLILKFSNKDKKLCVQLLMCY